MRTVELRATLFRRVSRGREPLSTEGSRLRGGRYNRPGVPALYLACTAALARQEFEKHSAHVGLAIKKPGLSVAVNVRLERVLDLTDAAALKQLGVSIQDLCGDSTELTREIGDAARLANIQAIRYPSAVNPRSCNVVIFEENIGSENLVLKTVDDDWPETDNG